MDSPAPASWKDLVIAQLRCVMIARRIRASTVRCNMAQPLCAEWSHHTAHALRLWRPAPAGCGQVALAVKVDVSFHTASIRGDRYAG